MDRRSLAPPSCGECPDCGKTRWRTRHAASRAADILARQDPMGAYRCGSWWHIGGRNPVHPPGATRNSTANGGTP